MAKFGPGARIEARPTPCDRPRETVVEAGEYRPKFENLTGLRRARQAAELDIPWSILARSWPWRGSSYEKGTLHRGAGQNAKGPKREESA